jgi:hypothetical protein
MNTLSDTGHGEADTNPKTENRDLAAMSYVGETLPERGMTLMGDVMRASE